MDVLCAYLEPAKVAGLPVPESRGHTASRGLVSGAALSCPTLPPTKRQDNNDDAAWVSSLAPPSDKRGMAYRDRKGTGTVESESVALARRYVLRHQGTGSDTIEPPRAGKYPILTKTQNPGNLLSVMDPGGDAGIGYPGLSSIIQLLSSNRT
jgi:hypothetical protein